MNGELACHEWPVCPQCFARRQTVCPVCQVAGSDFPAADYQAPVAPQRQSDGSWGPQTAAGEVLASPLLLLCPTCDEAFPPQYYRRCQRCGHDFGQGIDVQPQGAELPPARVLLATAGLALLGGMAILYLWWVFRS